MCKDFWEPFFRESYCNALVCRAAGLDSGHRGFHPLRNEAIRRNDKRYTIVSRNASLFRDSLLVDPDPFYPTIWTVCFGILLWTLLEYSLHRWVFHLEPSGRSQAMIYFHFAIHGLHHKVIVHFACVWFNL